MWSLNNGDYECENLKKWVRKEAENRASDDCSEGWCTLPEIHELSYYNGTLDKYRDFNPNSIDDLLRATYDDMISDMRCDYDRTY